MDGKELDLQRLSGCYVFHVYLAGLTDEVKDRTKTPACYLVINQSIDQLLTCRERWEILFSVMLEQHDL